MKSLTNIALKYINHGTVYATPEYFKDKRDFPKEKQSLP